jgi:hypothetical protein
LKTNDLSASICVYLRLIPLSNHPARAAWRNQKLGDWPTVRWLAPVAAIFRPLMLLALYCALAIPPAMAECVRIKVQDPSGLAVSGARILVNGRELISDLEGAAQACGLNAALHDVTILTAHFERQTFQVDAAAAEAVLRLSLRTRVETPIVVTGTTEPRELAEIDRSMSVLPVEEPEVPA